MASAQPLVSVHAPWPFFVLRDALREAASTLHAPSPQTKLWQLRRAARKGRADTFLETGTWKGETALQMSRHLRDVITIELDPTLAREARERFTRAGRANIHVATGDAAVLVPTFLDGCKDRRVLLYLDGHWSGPGTAHGPVAEPAADIISKLTPYAECLTAVVIDDLRTFGQHDTPQLNQVIRAAETALPDWRIRFAYDQIHLTPPTEVAR